MDNKINLILHPVRMRIITTISGRTMTAGQLAQALPDVAQATLYRQISALVEGGILAIVDQTPIRGTVEKLYALESPEVVNITADELNNASKDDHMRFFTTFLVTLIADYSRYLQSRTEIHPAKDGVGYHTVPLYLSDEDMKDFAGELQALMGRYQHPQADRSRRLFSFVLMPSEESEDT